MRLAAYLCTSRHGIFYFRFPVPVEYHPDRKRSHIKVSLSTREPKEARDLARRLVVAGQAAMVQPIVRAMRYDEMREHVREHFSLALSRFKERVAEDGPPDDIELGALLVAKEQAEKDIEDWLDLTRYVSAADLVQEFCTRRGIREAPNGRSATILALELQKGHRDYMARALAHIGELDTLPLVQSAALECAAAPVPKEGVSQPVDAISFDEVADRYFAEMERNEALAEKTEADKRDALALLAELTDVKAPALLTKADAREVKATLFKLPKNRNKNPNTRDLPLGEMLEVPGVERLSARTMNAYLGHMQTFFSWAVNNGYASENIFAGLKIRKKKGAEEEGRKAFTAEQLQLMYAHLRDVESPIVRKDVHKWPALIGMFTGMRLNEIAQLEVQDIDQHDGIWCINVTPDGDDKKRIKNSASKRLVPIHDRLLECGLLDFRQSRLDAQVPRLFPDLPYSPQNGYGRNAGRWFNERFLKHLGFEDGLVFHCFRHTMQTRLAHADVPQPRISAILGHAQTGVSLTTYFKANFLPSQLHEAINRFSF